MADKLSSIHHQCWKYPSSLWKKEETSVEKFVFLIYQKSKMFLKIEWFTFGIVVGSFRMGFVTVHITMHNAYWNWSCLSSAMGWTSEIDIWKILWDGHWKTESEREWKQVKHHQLYVKSIPGEKLIEAMDTLTVPVW